MAGGGWHCCRRAREGDPELRVCNRHGHDSIRTGPRACFSKKWKRGKVQKSLLFHEQERHGGGVAPNWPLEIGLLAQDRKLRIPHIKCPSDAMDATERLTKETTHLYGRYKEASRVAIYHGKEPGPRQETNLSLSLGRYTCPALLDGGTGKSWKDAARDWWLTRDKTDNWRSLV